MPLRYYENKARQKWNRYKECGTMVANDARRALQGVQYIKGLVNSEMFHVDIDTSLTPDTSSQVQHVTGVAQNNTIGSRTGNSILAKSNYFRCTITKHASATNTFVRVIMFVDRQQVADTTPSITDVLTTITVDSCLNINNAGRFKILSDKIFMLSDANGDMRQWKKYIRFGRKGKGMHVRYNGTATTDIQKNGFYIAFLSNEATNTPTLSYNNRFSYHDN